MTTTRGHCLIINSYSFRNAGDAAIMLATKQLLESEGAASVTLSSRYDDSSDYSRFGLRVVPEIVPFPAEGARLSRAARAVYGLAASLLVIAGAAVSRSFARILARALLPRTSRITRTTDTVVIAGGGYMYSSKRRLNLSLYQSLVSIRLGDALTGSTLMMPQSIGPVTRPFDRWLIQWSLRHTTVVVREKLSLAASTVPLQLPARDVDDVAFFYTAQTTADAVSDVCRIVAMDWRWSTSVNQVAFEEYVLRVAEIATRVHELGLRVVLGGHSSLPEHKQDDILVAKMISARLSFPHEVDENTDVAHLYDEYARSRVVVGTRLHACIMAISVGTPAISLQYQEKSRGVLRRLGLDRYVHRVDELDVNEIVSQVGEIAAAEERWSDVAEKTRSAIAGAYREICS
ncbi:polysaccharide pyruvyl transferase family protein [Microbacterium enclense]|uniref:polysaccharide pyruvyl transferase family protein n=1 Tax=Microbacterium enclense TaxID=993073 RepID=UPI00203B05BA|nr:polysaccharide pyruvyl transferase family protein [Microbacterium enclense]MCM3614324.1 polysaccharide pyruvyl transferase family protein [Microbacterium enclense]